MATPDQVAHLKEKALEMRKRLLRLGYEASGLHLGGDLSMADMMTVIFEYMLNVDPADPENPGRDRFVLSKGHGAGALYISMANAGFFDIEEIYETYTKLGTRFGVHPCRNHLPGVEASTGSLGHGLPIGVGMALAGKIRGQDHRVVVLTGDGEMAEGTIWEAAMSASQFKLGNLVLFVDNNGLCLDGFTEDIMEIEDLEAKLAAFGWLTVRVADGNSIEQLVDAVDNLPPATADRPVALICNTVKGSGVDFMENSPAWHSGNLDAELLAKCLDQVEQRFAGTWPGTPQSHGERRDKETVNG